MPFRVVIAGGGVAGVEAILALSRLAPGLAQVELLAPSDEFVDRSMFVAEPFGSGKPRRLNLDRLAHEADATHTSDALVAVDPGAHSVVTADGRTLAYDALLVAPGAKPVEAVSGALTFSGEPERHRFTELLASVGHAHMRRVAFVVPHGVSWSIAAYELALLTAAERTARRLRGVEIKLVTHESAPLALFGESAAALVADKLKESEIELVHSSVAQRFADGTLHLEEGAPVEVDAVVALPSLMVPPLRGLPQNKRGFVLTDVRMNVAGLSDVWAAGDVTSFPVKQGGLAAQQADVAARSIAVRAGARVPIEPFRPVLRGALITGDTPEFLRTRIAGSAPGVAATGHGLWWPPQKIAGRYLSPRVVPTAEGEASPDELVDVAPPSDPGAEEDEHERAVNLVLATAETDAANGNFEGALKWLALVEELNLVLPPEYVARRHEWRLQLDPGAEPGAAAKRIDPRFDSAAAAISDLQRRVGWMRRTEQQAEGEMRTHHSDLDRGIEALRSISRRARIEIPERSDRGI
jgi:sulfide:quinone oxidoreductase